MSVRRAWALSCILALVAVLPDPVLGAPRPKPGTTGPILVEWRRDVWLPPELRTMNESGGEQAMVVNDLLRGGRARWSPDGTLIAGYKKPNGGEGQWDRALMSITANGSAEQMVLTAAAFDAFNFARGLKSGAEKGFGIPFGPPAYSPAGDELIFSGLVRYEGPTTAALDDRYRHRLFAVSLDGAARIRALTDGDGDFDDFDPHWSGGANRIVFVRTAVEQCARCEGVANPVGQQELWVVSPDGSDVYQLTSFATHGLPSGSGRQLAAPAWNRQGSRIAVVGGLSDTDFYSGDLWLIDLAEDAQGRPMLVSVSPGAARPNASEWHPAWSPVGDRLLFIRRSAANSRNTLYELVIHNIGTGTESIVESSTKQAILYPDWRQ